MNMTTQTIEYPFRQRHLLPMSTGATCLARVGRIDFHQLTPSFLRFGCKLTEECRPRGIRNALGKTMVVDHPVDAEVFHADDTKSSNDGMRVLMGEVLTSECYPLMHTSHGLAMLVSLGCAFGELTMLALHVCQGLFFVTEKARVLNLFTSRERRKGLQPYVNPNLGRQFRQSFWFAFNRERSVPLARAAFANSERFNLTPYRAVVDHFNGPNLGEADLIIMGDAEARLWEGEAVIATLALKARIARVFTRFTATEEGLKRQFYALGDMLQDLRMDRGKGRPLCFQYRNTLLGVVPGYVLLSLFPGILTVSQRLIIEPSTFLQNGFKLLQLLLGRIQPILKPLSHTRQDILVLDELQALSKFGTLRGKAVSPDLKTRGLSLSGSPFDAKLIPKRPYKPLEHVVQHIRLFHYQ